MRWRKTTGIWWSLVKAQSRGLSMLRTLTPWSTALALVGQARSLLTLVNWTTSTTPGTWTTCPTSSTHWCSFLVSMTLAASTSPGYMSGWNTPLSAGITKTWCFTRSTTVTGVNPRCGTVCQTTTERNLKRLSGKSLASFSKRTQTFWCTWSPWFPPLTWPSVGLRSIRRFRSPENSFWPCLAHTMRVFQLE